MPTVRTNRHVSLEETKGALQGAFGPYYEVSRRSVGSLSVRQNEVVSATVYLRWGEGFTAFSVSGGGHVVLKVINSIGLARRINNVLRRSFAVLATS